MLFRCEVKPSRGGGGRQAVPDRGKGHSTRRKDGATAASRGRDPAAAPSAGWTDRSIRASGRLCAAGVGRDPVPGTAPFPACRPLSQAKTNGHVERSDWHVVRDLSSRNLERLRASSAGATWQKIPERLRPACHRDGYLGFTNVYGRMKWDRPAPTITAGCTTFSKGRFGHPDADRTISVREAALLQTFPLGYRLDTPYMDHVCNMIGNALPCDFAEAVSRQCAQQLRSHSAAERPIESANGW